MHAGKNLRALKSPSERRLNGTTEIMLAVVVFMVSSLIQNDVWAGGSCVIAKRLGDSLAIEWVASSKVSAETALLQAKQQLLEQGYRKKGQDVHAQASSDLTHAYLVIVKTVYTTTLGKSRTSYGCGFSARTATEAEQAALYNLRNYSWGWQPEFGYEVLKRVRY
ncbi:MAG: hypothetical protein P8179_19385 [Candidatus Thiodiazotropha sp.]|jgi:hypothetical protein